MKSLIQRLVETPAPSGYEAAVREVILEEIKPLADSWHIDALGNLIVRKGEKGEKGLRILLAAHIDEIGLIATHVDQKGFVRFIAVGGVRTINLVGSRVRFLNGSPGVIGIEKRESEDRIPGFDQLYIDTGAESREASRVRVGDMAVFERPFIDLGNRLVAKAMDDRIGVAVLVEVLRRLQNSPHEVYFVFSVQEEVGSRGATAAAYGIDADIGLSVDLTHSGDTPKGMKMETALGNGAAIKVRDSGMLSDPRLVQALIDVAERYHIPYQLEVLEAGTTDARVIQITRSGVSTGCVSIPGRYIHTPSEMIDMRDVEAAVQLLEKFVSDPTGMEWLSRK